MSHLTSHHTLPPFDDTVPTAPLVSVSLASLQAGDAAASAALFEACKQLGFFYLDLNGSALGETLVAEAEELNLLQKEFFKLPYDVKDVYGRPHLHPFYAYRYTNAKEMGADGLPLRKENYNVRRHLWPVRAPRVPPDDPRRQRPVQALRPALPRGRRLHARAPQRAPRAAGGHARRAAPHQRALGRPRALHPGAAGQGRRGGPRGRAHRLWVAHHALQLGRRAPDPHARHRGVGLRQARPGLVHRQPGRRHGHLHRRPLALQHPPRRAPDRPPGPVAPQQPRLLLASRGRRHPAPAQGRCHRRPARVRRRAARDDVRGLDPRQGHWPAPRRLHRQGLRGQAARHARRGPARCCPGSIGPGRHRITRSPTAAD